MEELRVGKSSFDKDYLILPFDMFDEYMSKYYETAMLWGILVINQLTKIHIK